MYFKTMQEYQKLNAAKIKLKAQARYQSNAAKNKLREQARYQKNAQKVKVRCKLDSQKLKAKDHSEQANVLQKMQATYHSHKQAKLDACEKLRQQDPRGRKVLSRAAIKKAISKKFRFGKNHVDVQNHEGKWIKVKGRRFYRVYIAMNHPKRIKLESAVPFYGKARWLVQVSVAFLFFCFPPGGSVCIALNAVESVWQMCACALLA
jgi:hypothetical protein